jgi:hypothetical protein
MNESILRIYVRRILAEIIEPRSYAAIDKDADVLPKGEWVLLQPGDQHLEMIKSTLWDLVKKTYAPIGGHTKVSTVDDLSRYRFWVVKDLDEDPEPDVAIFGKPDTGGAKMGGAANDGSRAASAAYKSKSAELRSGGSVGGVGNWWGEVSGKPAYAMISRGAPVIEDPAHVAALLAGDVYTWHGKHPDPNAPELFKSVDGWYTKDFGPGGKHTKIIIGSPA